MVRWDETSVVDAEPSLPMRKTELAHVGRTAVGLHADQFFEIEWLTLGRKFLGFRFGGLLEREARGGQSPARMDQLFLSLSGIADDRPHLIGVHLVCRHQVDQAFGVLGPLRDPVFVFHAIKIADVDGSSLIRI